MLSGLGRGLHHASTSHAPCRPPPTERKHGFTSLADVPTQIGADDGLPRYNGSVPVGTGSWVPVFPWQVQRAGFVELVESVPAHVVKASARMRLLPVELTLFGCASDEGSAQSVDVAQNGAGR